jgi:hypothetical protein
MVDPLCTRSSYESDGDANEEEEEKGSNLDDNSVIIDGPAPI